MKDTTVVTIPSDPRYLGLVRDAAARMALIAGIESSAAEAVKHAVNEACANVIKYAYLGDPGRSITVKMRSRRRGFEVLIEDSGITANPDLIKGRSLEDVRPGGLGVHLIRRAFDVVRFEERGRQGNRLRLLKRVDRERADRDH
jgi:anti-sigma regulatory factor (Ser/Thr protein kinase)